MQTFEKFRDEVLNDPDMQRELVGIDRADQFVERAVALAAERGLTLSREELREAMRRARKSWGERWI